MTGPALADCAPAKLVRMVTSLVALGEPADFRHKPKVPARSGGGRAPAVDHRRAHGVDHRSRQQVGHSPALQVGLCHALLGEAFEARGLARRCDSPERLDVDLVVAPSIVALVECVPTAELGPHHILEELHQLGVLQPRRDEGTLVNRPRVQCTQHTMPCSPEEQSKTAQKPLDVAAFSCYFSRP